KRLLLLLEGLRLLVVRLRLRARLGLVRLGLALGLLGFALCAQLGVVGDVADLALGCALDLLASTHQLCTASLVFCAAVCACSAPAARASYERASTSARTAFKRSLPLSCWTWPALVSRSLSARVPAISLPSPTALSSRPAAFLMSIRGIASAMC